jgi:hypothetical protein
MRARRRGLVIRGLSSKRRLRLVLRTRPLFRDCLHANMVHVFAPVNGPPHHCDQIIAPHFCGRTTEVPVTNKCSHSLGLARYDTMSLPGLSPHHERVMVPQTDARSKLLYLALNQLSFLPSLGDRDARPRHLSLGLANPKPFWKGTATPDLLPLRSPSIKRAVTAKWPGTRCVLRMW